MLESGIWLHAGEDVVCTPPGSNVCNLNVAARAAALAKMSDFVTKFLNISNNNF